MNKFIKKLIGTAMTLICINVNIKPVSETTAFVGSAVGGALVGTTAGAGTYFLAFDGDSNQTLRVAISTLVGLAFEGLTSYGLYQHLYSLTPSGRLALVQEIINNPMMDNLISKNFNSHEELISYITTQHGIRDLSVADNYYKGVAKNITSAKILKDLIFQEVKNKKNYEAISTECTKLNQKIYHLEQIIKLHETAIRLARAQQLINDAMTSPLIRKNFTTHEDLISHIMVQFGTNWPLVLASQKCITIANNLQAAYKMLHNVEQEVQNNTMHTMFLLPCSQAKQQIPELEQIVQLRVLEITKDEKYDQQVLLFEKNQEADRQRKEAERQRKHEEQLLQQKLYNKQKLLGEKFTHDSWERSRDRQHENNLADRH